MLIKKLKYTILILFIALISGCAASESQKNTDNEKPSVLTSTREFIRIRHGISTSDAANDIAVKWCREQNLNADKTKSHCSGPCITAYLCR